MLDGEQSLFSFKDTLAWACIESGMTSSEQVGATPTKQAETKRIGDLSSERTTKFEQSASRR